MQATRDFAFRVLEPALQILTTQVNRSTHISCLQTPGEMTCGTSPHVSVYAFCLSQATTSDSAAFHQQQDDWNAKTQGIQKLPSSWESTQHSPFFSSPDFGILYGFMVSSKWTYGHPLCFTRCPNEVKIHLRKSETLQIPSMQHRHEMQRMDLILQVVTPKSTPLPMSWKLKLFSSPVDRCLQKHYEGQDHFLLQCILPVQKCFHRLHGFCADRPCTCCGNVLKKSYMASGFRQDQRS